MIIQGTNIFMIRGDTEAVGVTLKDLEGNKIPLAAGDKVYLTVKRSSSTIDKVLQKVATEFTNGEALLTIFPNDTKLVEVGKYYYDIQLTKENGDIKTIIPKSLFEIGEEITYE